MSANGKSANFDKNTFTPKWIRVGQLSVLFRSAQREYNEAHAQSIITNFDNEMFGILAVTQPNGEGIYHIIDGQHRKGAMQSMYGDNEKVPCIILDAKDPKRAAQLFNRLNTSRKAPSAIASFKVRVTAEEEVEVAVNKIVIDAGYKIALGPHEGHLGAVTAVVRMYRRNGGEALKITLAMIQQTWGKDSNAVAAPIICGMNSFVGLYRDKIDWKRLPDRLGRTHTPGRLVAAAKVMKEANHVTMEAAMRDVIRRVYNQGLRQGHGKLGEKE